MTGSLPATENGLNDRAFASQPFLLSDSHAPPTAQKPNSRRTNNQKFKSCFASVYTGLTLILICIHRIRSHITVTIRDSSLGDGEVPGYRDAAPRGCQHPRGGPFSTLALPTCPRRKPPSIIHSRPPRNLFRSAITISTVPIAFHGPPPFSVIFGNMRQINDLRGNG